LGAHSQKAIRNELKVIQLFFTWIAVQERFQAIPSPFEMFGFVTGAGSPGCAVPNI
jgi:hypothetical protein